MNPNDYTSLFASLDHAVEILHRNRTPDPGLIAAYDTLKQARAMLARALSSPEPVRFDSDTELAAA